MMGVHDITFFNIINRNALCFKYREAWLELADNRNINFSEYLEKVRSIACGLQKAGIVKGDRIGVLGKNSLEYFLLYGAAAAAGAVILPVNWRLSPEEIGFVLSDGEPKVVFADQEYEEALKGMHQNLPSVEQYFHLGSEVGSLKDFNSLMSYGDAFNEPEVSTDDGFVIIHTAAVAGRPRGALLSHGNVLWANMHFLYQIRLSASDVLLNMLPLFHVGGLFATTAIFHAGGLTLNMNKFDASAAASTIQERGATFLVEFPPILKSILDEHEKSGADLKSLRAVGGLDNPDTIERYQRLTGGTFYSLYGQTETSCLATFASYDEKPGSAGKTLPMAEVKLVDDHDYPVAQGQVGEITVKGPMVFKGYWNLPEDTAYTFREGWHHTGDLGRFDDKGFLWYAGRKAEKELIKPGGENVYPIEVEKVILQHPAVEKTVVIGVPDPKWKEGIKAVCQLKDGERLEPQELIDFVGARIARYKKPQYVEFVSTLPLLEDGSVDRKKVKEEYGGL